MGEFILNRVIDGDYKWQGLMIKNGYVVITLPLLKTVRIDRYNVMEYNYSPVTNRVYLEFVDGKKSTLQVNKNYLNMIISNLHGLPFADWRDTQGKKKSSGILFLILVSIFDVLMLRMISSGYKEISYWFMILICATVTAVAWFRFKAISYQKHNCIHAKTLNDAMNGALTLTTYFENRDELIPLLQTFAKQEILVGGSNYFNDKPSRLLEQIIGNENLSVYSAIKREYEYLMYRVKNGEGPQSELFLNHISACDYRLSADNKNTANTFLAMLKEYERIAGKIEEADTLDGHAFEYWCADLLKKNGFSNVEVTQGSGDQGVDIIAVKDGIRYAIQCKRYSSNLDNTPVQEVHTGKSIYNCQISAVMTNRYFTAGAKKAAEATRTLLWDRDKLVEMLEK